MVPLVGKILAVDTVFQNRLKTIKKIMKFDVNQKKNCSRVLGVTPMWLPLKKKF